ncbi:hypothetical protein AURDEDRAFT_178847 [Auricularia subglabra TFB-10046 SS5]|nr:hypothetical protein AURDEDRAFT_178847 [Auricularia subglabra TFB-10046 SS5]
MSTPSPTGTRHTTPDAGGGRARLVSPGADAAVPSESHTEASSEATRVTPPTQTQIAGASGAPPAGTPAPHPTAPQPQVHASQTVQHAQAQVHGAASGTTTPQAPPPQLLPSGTRLVRCNYLGCGRWFAGNDRRAHASVHCVTTHLRFQALAEALAAPFLSDHQVA